MGMKAWADVSGEAVSLAGGGCAILLQVANPSVGYGVTQHSSFADDPMKRLRGTLTYVYALSGGSSEEIAAVAKIVNDAHGRVSGTTPDGRGFTAFDPELQLWVAATMYYSASRVNEIMFGKLDEETAEAIYQEYGLLGSVLQMPAELWPKNRSAFWEYFDNAVEKLALDDTTRGLAEQMFTSKRLPMYLRIFMPLGRFVTLGLLPERVRSMYGYDWSDKSEKRYLKMWNVLRIVYKFIPKKLRGYPKRYYLGKLRNRMKGNYGNG